MVYIRNLIKVMTVLIFQFYSSSSNASDHPGAMEKLLFNHSQMVENPLVIARDTDNDFKMIYVAIDTLNIIVNFQDYTKHNYRYQDATEDEIDEGIFEFIALTYRKALETLFRQQSRYDIAENKTRMKAIMEKLYYTNLEDSTPGDKKEEHLSLLSVITKVVVEQELNYYIGKVKSMDVHQIYANLNERKNTSFNKYQSNAFTDTEKWLRKEESDIDIQDKANFFFMEAARTVRKTIGNDIDKEDLKLATEWLEGAKKGTDYYEKRIKQVDKTSIQSSRSNMLKYSDLKYLHGPKMIRVKHDVVHELYISNKKPYVADIHYYVPAKIATSLDDTIKAITKKDSVPNANYDHARINLHVDSYNYSNEYVEEISEELKKYSIKYGKNMPPINRLHVDFSDLYEVKSGLLNKGATDDIGSYIKQCVKNLTHFTGIIKEDSLGEINIEADEYGSYIYPDVVNSISLKEGTLKLITPAASVNFPVALAKNGEQIARSIEIDIGSLTHPNRKKMNLGEDHKLFTSLPKGLRSLTIKVESDPHRFFYKTVYDILEDIHDNKLYDLVLSLDKDNFRKFIEVNDKEGKHKKLVGGPQGVPGGPIIGFSSVKDTNIGLRKDGTDVFPFEVKEPYRGILQIKLKKGN